MRDTCDGRDTDCDGFPNTGCGCTRGMTRTCYSGAAGTAGRGLCRNGTQTCVTTISGTGTVWGPCAGEVVPAADVCNGVDRNCDGNPNTGCACTIDAAEVCYRGPAGTQTSGRCRPGSRRCNALVRPDGTLSSVWGVCLGQALPGAAEICGNRIDDNCSGMVDEACAPDCAAGTIRCAGRCIDVRSDVMNCGACGNVCAAGQACANGVCVGNGLLRITMVWSVPGDMDLHVVPPCGQEISFLATNRCGGQLDRDDTTTTGPENVFWAAAPASGTYLVCAVPYRVSGATNVTVSTWRVRLRPRNSPHPDVTHFVVISPTEPALAVALSIEVADGGGDGGDEVSQGAHPAHVASAVLAGGQRGEVDPGEFVEGDGSVANAGVRRGDGVEAQARRRRLVAKKK